MADDVVSKVLFDVKADTRDLERNVKKGAEAFDQLGQSATKAQGGFASFLDNAAVGFGKFNLALGGVQKAMGLLKSGIDAVADVAAFKKLEKAVPTHVFKQLDSATGELYKRTDLLRFSTKALASDFKFSTAQMADVLKAATALSDQGYGPMEQISEKLIKSIAKGGEGMDEYGIIIAKTGDKVKDAAAVLEKLHGIADGGEISAESSALAKLNRGLEDLSLALKGVLATVVVGIVDVVDTAARILAGGGPAPGPKQRFMAPEGIPGPGESGPWSGPGGATDEDYEAAFGLLGIDVQKSRNARLAGKGIYPRSVARRGALSGTEVDTEQRRNRAREWAEKHQGEFRLGGRAGYREAGEHEVDYFERVGEGDFGGAMPTDLEFSSLEGVGQHLGPNASFGYGGGQDQASKWMEQMRDQASLAGGAFGVFESAFSSAVSAAVDGSESMGKAFARASSAGLKALSVEYAVRALGEGAWAIASLAAGDAKGAALHGAGALKFGAAAVAAGVGSGLLGGLAGGSGAAAGGGYATPARAVSAAPESNRPIVINMGDGFYGDDKKTAQAVSDAVRQAEREGARRSYGARFSG